MAKQASFAGQHTLKKLGAVEKYLQSYATVMKKQNFVTVFFDAFAGTGELPLETQAPGLFDHEAEGRTFAEGSARRALGVTPSFDRYVFVERMKGKATELSRLKDEFKELAPRIEIVHGDANEALLEFCSNTNWQVTRAVVFLDPFGNQVSFESIRAIARCNIDLWYLFPAGIGVNRQISNDGTVVASAECRCNPEMALSAQS